MLNLSTWPDGMRILIRREHPHPGAALSLFEDADGWRYQAVATNTPLATGGQVAFLEARHRAHAVLEHVETRIRHAKETGIGRFPSREYAINHSCLSMLIASSVAADLIAWLRLLALPAKLNACEPKALRYRLLHVPTRLTHGARKMRTCVRRWTWRCRVLSCPRCQTQSEVWKGPGRLPIPQSCREPARGGSTNTVRPRDAVPRVGVPS